jgi:O-antigen ligase
MQVIGTSSAESSRGLFQVVLLVGLAAVVATATAIAGPLAVLPVFGALFVVVVVARPEYGIALFLSTFLMTYPQALQGSGFLTINNVLGGLFLILLTYKVYREEDWWFLRNRELQLFGLILFFYYASEFFNGPDRHLVELIGVQEHSAANLRTFTNRILFTLFFVNFIRTQEHVRMIYLLALAFMVASSFSGVQSVLQGGGLYGYRATTGASLIASAFNPNRLAMFAILAMAGLWYLRRSPQLPGLRLFIVPTMVVLALAVFMTASRSGLLGMAVALAAILIDERANVRTIFSMLLGGLLLMVLVVQFVPQRSLDRITNLPGTAAGEAGEGAGSLSRRDYTARLAFELFLENPFLGVGMGNWEVARFLKDPARSTAAPHSSYLLALVEGGVFCLAAFLMLLWRTWRNLGYAERWMQTADTPLVDLLWIIKASKASLLVLIFFSLFADLWQLVILFWLVGIGVVVRRLVEQEQQAEALAY